MSLRATTFPYCYAYRMPNGSRIVSGCARAKTVHYDNDGFMVAPFLPDIPPFIIPAEEKIDISEFNDYKSCSEESNIYPFPAFSTLPDQHAGEVTEIRNLENAGELEKCVAARCILHIQDIDVEATFLNMCRLYPDAFVYMFHTPESGFWIGASPELLLRGKGITIESMALAGTRQAGATEQWDSKNVGEQSVVTQRITECFAAFGLQTETSELQTRRAGNIEHLMNRIVATMGNVPVDIIALLRELSPTPALSGLPKKRALEVIRQTENFRRGYYGGYCGPWRQPQDFALFVNLRCARVKEHSICLFAGGGIMPQSDTDQEWMETTRKARTVLNAIVPVESPGK